ncbi:putative reverse transcriptase domain-containing protein [Tanacetum coccineum]
MAPKRTTRSTPATTTTPTTFVTDEKLKRLIEQGVANALAGTKGVIELTQWFERIEIVFRISSCSVENQIKFSTCTLLGSALTWWNSHVKTVGHDELALMCARMFPEESDKIAKYASGLPDMIHGSVMASKPKTMQDAIEFTTELMDKKIRTFAERRRSGDKKPYGGSKPLCSKCNYHHDGKYAPKCHKCNRVGHLARDCRSTANANTANKQTSTRAGQKATCFECGAQGHFKRECPKLKNNNHGNQGGNGNALAKVYTGVGLDDDGVEGLFACGGCEDSPGTQRFEVQYDRSALSRPDNYLVPKVVGAVSQAFKKLICESSEMVEFEGLQQNRKFTKSVMAIPSRLRKNYAGWAVQLECVLQCVARTQLCDGKKIRPDTFALNDGVNTKVTAMSGRNVRTSETDTRYQKLKIVQILSMRSLETVSCYESHRALRCRYITGRG